MLVLVLVLLVLVLVLVLPMLLPPLPLLQLLTPLLQFTDGKGNKNGTIYNEGITFGDQYFWDYRVPEAAAYFVSSVVKSLDSPFVDGTFTDDVGGCCAEHGSAQRNIKMSNAELKDLQAATALTHAKLVTALVKAGKFNWQAFGGGDGTGPGLPAPRGAACTAWMDAFCAAGKQKLPMMMAAGDDSNSTVAAFLIVRPPIAFLGWGWECVLLVELLVLVLLLVVLVLALLLLLLILLFRSDDKKWPKSNIFNLQAGKPTSICKTESPGVYR